MPKSRFHLPNSLRMGLLIAALVGLLIATLAWFQIERERQNDLEEMDRRAYVLAHQIAYSVQAALQLPDAEAATTLGSMLEGYRRLIGLAVYRTDGRLVAAGKGMIDFSDLLHQAVGQAVAKSKDIVETRRTNDAHVHLLASVIRAPDGQPQGALAVLHDLVSLDERATHRQALFGFWIGVIVLSLLILTVAGAWLLYDRPLNRLAEWMRQLRTSDTVEAPPVELPTARLSSESDRLAASFRAARSAHQAQARAVVRADNVWTRDRLRAHVVDCLRGGQLLVVSNREPYMHELRDGKPRLIMPAGGLVTALDPVLQACGGVWVAHGSGEADRQMVDAQGRLAVPPDDPTYMDRMIEARLDWDHFAVELQGHASRVRPFPISVENWAERHVPTGETLVSQIAELKERYELGNTRIAVGVDRIDYTKGLTERFRAVARFLERCPQHRGKFTFVQLGAPSRTHIPRYRNYITELEALSDEINWRFQTESWKPIRFLIGHHDGVMVHAFLRMADLGIVSSLHDGMNLVAKEYVAAKLDLDGVLILSEFAGAARELADALIINPYDTEQFAEAIRRALEMPDAERHERMARMRRQVEENNIYRWAANFLADLTAAPILIPPTQGST